MSFLQILFISWFVEFYTISDGQILYLLGHSLLDCSIQPSCSYFIWYQVSLFCCKKYCKTVERTTKKCHFKNCIGWLLLFYFVEITLRDMCVSMDVCIVSEKKDEWNDEVWFKKGKTKKSETQSVDVIYFALTISRLQWVSSFHCHGYSSRTESNLYVLQNPKKWSRYFLFH